MGPLDLNLALIIHGGFEAIVGVLLLSHPRLIFPYIAQRASYNNSERALLRWFAFSIILQGILAALAVAFDAKNKRRVLSGFLAYHVAILFDAAYGYYRESVVDETAFGCHLILGLIIGFFLASGTHRAWSRSPRKRL